MVNVAGMDFLRGACEAPRHRVAYRKRWRDSIRNYCDACHEVYVVGFSMDISRGRLATMSQATTFSTKPQICRPSTVKSRTSLSHHQCPACGEDLTADKAIAWLRGTKRAHLGDRNAADREGYLLDNDAESVSGSPRRRRCRWCGTSLDDQEIL